MKDISTGDSRQTLAIRRKANKEDTYGKTWKTEYEGKISTRRGKA